VNEGRGRIAQVGIIRRPEQISKQMMNPDGAFLQHVRRVRPGEQLLRNIERHEKGLAGAQQIAGVRAGLGKLVQRVPERDQRFGTRICLGPRAAYLNGFGRMGQFRLGVTLIGRECAQVDV
jgi:hypothetical protein